MDVATTLPAEMWSRIFDLLSLEDIRKMRQVHSVFETYSRMFIWESLVLCSLGSKRMKQAEAIVCNPSLGQHVKELHLQPSIPKMGQTDPTRRPPMDLRATISLWFADPPIRTWSGVLSRIEWKHPIRSYRHISKSRKASSVASAVVPHLTQLRILCISTLLGRGARPSPEPYHELWSNIHTNNLTTIFFSLSPLAALQIFSGAVRSSQVTFPCLETLHLHVSSYREDKFDLDKFEEDIRVIADTGRDSLKALRLSHVPSYDLRPPASRLFSGIGFFPNLAHFDFFAYFCDDETPVTRFITHHHSSLRRLNIEGCVHQIFPRLHVLEINSFPSMRLTCLGFKYEVLHDHGLAWAPMGEPSLRSYADSLTTLRITPSFMDAFTFQHADRLVSSLYKSPGGALLQRLKIPISSLCPEVFDLLSNALENLHALAIMYNRLVAFVGSTANEPNLFWQSMRARTYPNWNVRQFSLEIIGTYGEPSREEKEILTLAIPSITMFEPSSWWDLDIRIEEHRCWK
ncbi:hypothetical protein BDN72DRAFT_413816 [Pluteus cervinus]|uniref:Uncharacterized protein n=1 Tax=Pluteus cervinus TaxID=181527 RepID=A0ACD3A8D1_9AGAR|nr:hypothetical protein BDN72DRAFT_413816 [Pluteus cervinus]